MTIDEAELAKLIVLVRVENTHYLEMTNYPKQKDGSVETRRSVQYWRGQSVTTKAVTELRSESTPRLRRISTLGYDLHGIEQIRNGNVRRHARKPQR